MKTLIMLMALFGSTAFAADCPDFTGNYVYKDDISTVKVTLVQTGCEKATLTYDYGVSTPVNTQMIFDGFKRVVHSDATYNSLMAYEINATEITGKGEYNAVDQGHVVSSTSTESYRLDAGKNLIFEQAFFDLAGKQTFHVLTVFQRLP